MEYYLYTFTIRTINLIMPNETEVNIPYTHSIWDIEPANLEPYGNNGGEDVPSGKHPFSGFAGSEFSPGKKPFFCEVAKAK